MLITIFVPEIQWHPTPQSVAFFPQLASLMSRGKPHNPHIITILFIILMYSPSFPCVLPARAASPAAMSISHAKRCYLQAHTCGIIKDGRPCLPLSLPPWRSTLRHTAVPAPLSSANYGAAYIGGAEIRPAACRCVMCEAALRLVAAQSAACVSVPRSPMRCAARNCPTVKLPSPAEAHSSSLLPRVEQ